MAKKPFSIVRAVLWIAAFVVINSMVNSARSRRVNREMWACVHDYDSARSKADTERIDKRWVMPTHAIFSRDTVGFTCRTFRPGLPANANRP